MRKVKAGINPVLIIMAAALSLQGCGGWWSPASGSHALPAATPLPSDADATETSIRYLEDKLKRDPEDFIAYNKLAGYYLQRHRETGDLKYLDLTTRAANASLAILPAERNIGALSGLAWAEYASHNFTAARDHAMQLAELDRGKSYPFQILGDALLELGEYDRATLAYRSMEQLGGGSANVEARLARHALLRGQTDIAVRKFSIALSRALELNPVPRETVAWCRWQLGEVAFSTGDYETAEQRYRDALVTFPDYYRALAALGKVYAARGDLSAAIEHYERAARIMPDPSFIAALGDIYKLAGKEREAAAQYALVEQIARLNALSGAVYSRQLALFYADHDMKLEEAYRIAAKEYESRRDISGADVVAWTALKTGRLAEAQAAIKEALRLGTRDARLFYHAGMIARAAGDNARARDYLKRALTLSPHFDPLQAKTAGSALKEIEE